MKKKRIYFFIGTTAELIKISPVIRELQRRKIKFKVITSGQGKIFFEELSNHIKPVKVDIAFKEKINKSSIFYFSVWALRTFFVSLFTLRTEFKTLNKTNSYFIVHGDTVSSLIGAFIATIYGLRLVHIESGLRSFNFFEPFPEEACRFIISHLAGIHFCPNSWSNNNLKNHKGTKVNTKENTLIESFWIEMKNKGESKFLKEINKTNIKYFILIVHRQEHVFFWKEKTRKMLEFLFNNTNKNLVCFFITHETTSNFLKKINFKSNLITEERMLITQRLPYSDFLNLLRGAEYFVTDGGANQEEAYYLGKPCLVIRNCTERIEGLNRNVVLAKGSEKVIKDFLGNYKKYKKKMVRFKARPSKIIVNYLVKIN